MLFLINARLQSMVINRAIVILLLLLVFYPSAKANAATYYVATTGSNAADGSAIHPWQTIHYALNRVNSADTIVVRDGIYNGSIYTSRSFSEWVSVVAEHPYHVKLTNIQNGSAQTIFFVYTPGSAKINIEGFVFSNVVPGYSCADREPYYLVHFQDAQDMMLKNSILYGNSAPGGCNELLKINRGGDPYYPKNILIEGNVFYDPANAGGSDMIDSVRPGELDIFDNIFFARNAPNAQSFITLKTEVIAANLGIQPRSPRHRIMRNVFLNWSGKTDQAFIQLGEDGNAQNMITDALIENNLFIGNSSTRMAAPIQLKGPKGVTVRANTIVGDYANTTTFGFRVGTEGDNLQVRDIFVYNNIFADPTGTMPARLFNVYGDVLTSSIVLDNNLFWNALNALPQQGTPTPAADLNRIEANPLLPVDQNNITLPIFDENTQRFISGNTSIRAEFERLVNAYGAIPGSSPAVDLADSALMPLDDILGNPRGSASDIGAFEYQSVRQQAVHADFDGDGISDIAVWRPSTGYWFILTSRSAFDYNQHQSSQLGLPGDLPLTGDFDGDRIADMAVWRPANGTWYFRLSGNDFQTISAIQWGLPEDQPLAGDYDGDGKSDLAIYRRQAGMFYVLRSAGGFNRSEALRGSSEHLISVSLGGLGNDPVVGDLTGDGRDDFITVWQLLRFWSVKDYRGQLLSSLPWGMPGDTPLVCDFDANGTADRVIVRVNAGNTLDWYVALDRGGAESLTFASLGDLPRCRADFDNDGHGDIAVFRPQSGEWFIRESSSNLLRAIQFGMPGDIPVS
jgi:hypothetical protein